MKQCLSCGEKVFGKRPMHPRCIKKVFNTRAVPMLILYPEDLPPQPLLPMSNISLSSLQPEIPIIHLRKDRRLRRSGRLPVYTLKLPLRMIKNLTQNQNLCMTIASRLNVPIPAQTLMSLDDENKGKFGLLIKHFDRDREGNKLRQKSLLEIMGKNNRHDTSLEEIGNKIKRISEVPGLAVQLFLEMVMFSFIIGHSDLHMEKFSVLYEDKKKNVRLAPMQDLLCTKLLYPVEPDFAIPMMGKTENLTGQDFKTFSQHLGIHPKAYNKIFLRFFEGKRGITRAIRHSFLEMDEQLKFSELVNERFKRLMT